MNLKIIIFVVTLSIFFTNLYSEENIDCRNLSNKPIEYTKCITEKSKEVGKKSLKKLNTDSKLTDWLKKKLNK